MNLSERVYRAIEKSILEGYIKPGERIVETRIASKLGVSKSPVREALKQLEAYDIVELLPRKGFVVRKIDRKRVADFYEVALMLEQMTAKLAIANKTESGLKELESVLDRMGGYASKEDHESYMAGNDEFHRKLRELTGNQWIIKIADMVQRQTKMFRAISLYATHSFFESMREHRAIFEAYRNGDEEVLRKLLCHHQVRVKENILRSNFL